MSLCVSLFITLSNSVCLTSSILHDHKNNQDSISREGIYNCQMLKNQIIEGCIFHENV